MNWAALAFLGGIQRLYGQLGFLQTMNVDIQKSSATETIGNIDGVIPNACRVRSVFKVYILLPISNK